MESEGHKIPFIIHSNKKEYGYILVKRSGWIGFEYKCYIEGKQLLEATETVATNQEDQMFSVDIIEYMSTPVYYIILNLFFSFIDLITYLYLLG